MSYKRKTKEIHFLNPMVISKLIAIALELNTSAKMLPEAINSNNAAQLPISTIKLLFQQEDFPSLLQFTNL